MTGSAFGVIALMLFAGLGVAFVVVVTYAARKKAWVSLVCMLAFVPIGACFLAAMFLAAPSRVASNGGIQMTASPPSESVEATASAERSKGTIADKTRPSDTEDRAPRAGNRWSVGEAVDQLNWSTLLSAGLLAGLLAIAYLFLDANTRGHYTWPLRVGTAIAFAAICVFLWLAGPLF